MLSKDGSLLAVFKQIISEEPGVGESLTGQCFEVSSEAVETWMVRRESLGGIPRDFLRDHRVILANS